jgi:hypothetical protein
VDVAVDALHGMPAQVRAGAARLHEVANHVAAPLDDVGDLQAKARALERGASTRIWSLGTRKRRMSGTSPSTTPLRSTQSARLYRDFMPSVPPTPKGKPLVALLAVEALDGKPFPVLGTDDQPIAAVQ